MQIQKCRNHRQTSDAWLYTYELIAFVKTTRYLSPENNVNNKVCKRKWKLISKKLHCTNIWIKIFYFTRKKHLQDCKCFLCISSFLSAPPLLSIFCSSFLSSKICSQCGSACDSLSLCVAFAPANRFARCPGPGRIGSVHDRYKKRHSFECPFLYLSAASYPSEPPPAKYFRRLWA